MINKNKNENIDTVKQFEKRKKDHIRLALESEQQAAGLSGLASIHLFHEALPDLNFDEISLESDCLGKNLATPFFIAGMTAGHVDAERINRDLALACQERGWAMGIGSQRRDLHQQDNFKGGHFKGGNAIWREIRRETPGLSLFANIGLSQLRGASPDELINDLKRLVDRIQAQALAIHTNPLQEALQLEGTPNFKGAFSMLVSICKGLNLPVILKETGCGFSKDTLRRIADIGLAAVDVSGLGGTHWGRVEGVRAREAKAQVKALAAVTFAEWGESTTQSVVLAKEIFSGITNPVEIWASGGVRNGLDAAKLIALGATRVGYGQPALKAVLESPKALRDWMCLQEYELRVTLFCTGCKTPMALRQKEGAWSNVWKQSAI